MKKERNKQTNKQRRKLILKIRMICFTRGLVLSEYFTCTLMMLNI